MKVLENTSIYVTGKFSLYQNNEVFFNTMSQRIPFSYGYFLLKIEILEYNNNYQALLKIFTT